MSQKRREFSAEFKSRVLREVDGGKSIAEVTRQHHLSKNAVYDWRIAALSQSDTVSLTRLELVEMQSKIEALESAVGRLTMENDILKKIGRSRDRNGSESN
jgi:transposase-like protein